MAKQQRPFFMAPTGHGGFVRVPTHRGLGEQYHHGYDVKYDKTYKRKPSHRRNPPFRAHPASHHCGNRCLRCWRQGRYLVAEHETATICLRGLAL